MRLAYAVATILLVFSFAARVVAQNEDAEAARAEAAFEKGDYATATKIFRSLAEQGYARARAVPAASTLQS